VSDNGERRGVEELEIRLARLELTLLEIVTAVGMLVGELALRDDLVLTTPAAVEDALEHGWQALVGVPAQQDSPGVAVDQRFADAQRLADAAPAALENAVRDTGAAVGAFYAIANGEARLLSSTGYPAGVMESFSRFPISEDLPAAVAARTKRPLWFGAREEIVDTYPHLLDAHEQTEEALGEDAMQGAVVPLVAGGDVVAVAIIGFTQASPADESRLQAVRMRLAASLHGR
jgi:hypothetical protein